MYDSLSMDGADAETGWPYHLPKKNPNHGVNCQPPSPRQLEQCPSNIHFPSAFIRFVCGSSHWHCRGLDLQPMGWGWSELRWWVQGLSWIGTVNMGMPCVCCCYLGNCHWQPEPLWVFVLIFFKCVKQIAQIKQLFLWLFKKKKKP